MPVSNSTAKLTLLVESVGRDAMRSILGFSFGAFALLSLVAPLSASDQRKEIPVRVVGVKFGDILNIRKEPQPDAIVLGILPRNAVGIMIDGSTSPATKGWVQVKFDFEWPIEHLGETHYRVERYNVSGWVNRKFLSTSVPTKGVARKREGYSGEPAVKLLRDGGKVQLSEKFTYVDPIGVEWEVPKGAVVDGASIPRVLWSIVGSPFTGQYRDASIIHDYYCETKDRPWRSTHRVFYDAMVRSGTSPKRAQLMYFAVYRFGPRWTEGKVQCYYACADGGKVAIQITPDFDQQEFADGRKRIETERLSVEDIEKMADEGFLKAPERISGVFHGVSGDGKVENKSFKSGLEFGDSGLPGSAPLFPPGLLDLNAEQDK